MHLKLYPLAKVYNHLVRIACCNNCKLSLKCNLCVCFFIGVRATKFLGAANVSLSRLAAKTSVVGVRENFEM